MANQSLHSSGLCFSPFYENPIYQSDGGVKISFPPCGAKAITLRGMSDYTGLEDRVIELTPEADGSFTTTLYGIRPGTHYVVFECDGIKTVNPAMPLYWVLNQAVNSLDIPNPDYDFYDIQDVPHGQVRKVYYKSNLTGKTRCATVYTPPSYETDFEKHYPVLYLQHGSSENETGWVEQGKINFIADNLIARGECEELIIVNEHGYGFASGVTPSKDMRELHYQNKFGEVLIRDTIPFIESGFRVIADPAHRALTGLSMGGMQTANIVCANPGVFGYMGVMSAGIRGSRFQAEPTVADEALLKATLKEAFLSGGELELAPKGFVNLEVNKSFFDERGIPVHVVLSEGAHEWQAWRVAAWKLLPRLFK